ncbi:hypothetical protein [Methylobacterium hispanicum]
MSFTQRATKAGSLAESRATRASEAGSNASPVSLRQFVTARAAAS